jgi:hypothetical protein
MSALGRKRTAGLGGKQTLAHDPFMVVPSVFAARRRVLKDSLQTGSKDRTFTAVKKRKSIHIER